jgi:predicted transcriptional regulator of viral defense system
MRFEKLLEVVDNEPVFETGLLLAGSVDIKDVRRQLSRWVKAGKIYQLRRGLYSLASPYQKTVSHPFLVANRIVRSSYVSLQSALAYHGLIPEHVPVTTSVTTGRPNRWETPLGVFAYQHIQPRLFDGYRFLDMGGGQQVFIAAPEKALLDLIYLTPQADSAAYLSELRLQNLERLDVLFLEEMASRMDMPRLARATKWIIERVEHDSQEYETL